MRVAIVGVGGVGGYFGGKLARAGIDVTFVARGEHYAALAERGLSVFAVDGDFVVASLNVVDSIAKLERPDLVILATKTYDRDEAAVALRPILGESSIVISLLNGIDNDLQLQKLLPKARVYAGLAYVIAARKEPGVIEQTAGPRSIIFGERGVSASAELKNIETVMRQAGILATASNDIERELWAKYLWITAFAGMTSICRSPIGPIVCDPIGFELLTRCVDEGIAVANAVGVSFSEEERQKILAKAEQYRTTGSDAKASMLVDIEHRRKTEIESLNGTLLQLGRAHRVSTPTHEMIYAAVKIGSAEYLARG